MSKHISTWILVADGSRARLFQAGDHPGKLAQLKEWDHPASRAKNLDLVSDRPGRVAQSHGGPHPGHGSKSGMEPDLPAKEVEQEHFARTLGEELEKGLGDNAYSQLILVANPTFLGTLRQVVSEQVHKHLLASVDKDYTACTVKELQQHLASVPGL